MLLARGVSAGVAHIRLQEVVRRAQLTTGAAYRLWSDQDDFHRDLAVAFTRWRFDAPVAETRRIMDGLEMATAGSWNEMVRLAAAAHVGSIGDDSPSRRQFLITLALRASAQGSEDLTRASVERHRESVADFEEIYAALMKAHGYRMRSPLTVADFAVAVAALGEGFAVQTIQGIAHPVCRAEEAGVTEMGLAGGDWTLFALSVRALTEGFMTTEPGPEEK